MRAQGHEGQARSTPCKPPSALYKPAKQHRLISQTLLLEQVVICGLLLLHAGLRAYPTETGLSKNGSAFLLSTRQRSPRPSWIEIPTQAWKSFLLIGRLAVTAGFLDHICFLHVHSLRSLKQIALSSLIMFCSLRCLKMRTKPKPQDSGCP